jgi:hypothetical protein
MCIYIAQAGSNDQDDTGTDNEEGSKSGDLVFDLVLFRRIGTYFVLRLMKHTAYSPYRRGRSNTPIMTYLYVYVHDMSRYVVQRGPLLCAF